MNRKHKVEQYTAEETQQRFEVALRGARIAGPKHKESVTPKRVATQRKRETKPPDKKTGAKRGRR
jgi:hypothetical protein